MPINYQQNDSICNYWRDCRQNGSDKMPNNKLTVYVITEETIDKMTVTKRM